MTLFRRDYEFLIFDPIFSVRREEKPPESDQISRKPPHALWVAKLQFEHVSSGTEPLGALIFKRFSGVQHAHVVQIQYVPGLRR